MNVIIGLLLMLISIPFRDGKVTMNHVFGVRSRDSFTSERTGTR